MNYDRFKDWEGRSHFLPLGPPPPRWKVAPLISLGDCTCPCMYICGVYVFSSILKLFFVFSVSIEQIKLHLRIFFRLKFWFLSIQMVSKAHPICCRFFFSKIKLILDYLLLILMVPYGEEIWFPWPSLSFTCKAV